MDMDDEMRMHFELRVEKHLAAGMSSRDAHDSAMRAFGGVDQIKERCRDQRAWRWLEELIRDIAYAGRMLRKTPGFTALAILTLALGVGVTTTTYSYLRATIFRPLPFARPEGLFTFVGPQSPADLFDLKAQNEVFSKFAVLDFPSYSASLPGQLPERVSAFAVGGDFFAMLGVAPLIGRVFGPDEDRLGHDQVVVLSYQYWMKRFSGDPSIVGRSLRLDGEPFQVIGVMPEQFNIPTIWGAHDIWRPLAMMEDLKGVRDSEWLRAVVRLNADMPLTKAQADLDTIAERLGREHPATNKQRRFFMSRLGSPSPGREMQFYLLIAALAASVLMIACANLANLQLARGSGRSREYAIRAALGASRSRIVCQMLTESLMLSLMGGAVALLGTWWANRILSGIFARAFEHLPFLMSSDAPQSSFVLSVDTRVLVFTLATTIATAALFGIAPALLASRIDVSASLKQAGNRATGGRSRHRLRRSLIVAELSMTLVLLAGAAYFLNGFRRLAHRDMGWRADHLLTARIVLPYNRYGNDAKCRAFYDRFAEELATVHGVERSALCDSLPTYGFFNSDVVTAEGTAPTMIGHSPRAYFNWVSYDYFETLGTKLQLGRNFTAADRSGSRRVVIVDSELAPILFS